MVKSRKEAESEVRSWGFDHVFTWTDSPNAHYSPHKHSGKTTHLVLNGSITYTYPDDPDATKETIGPGARWDVDANKVHEVWVGNQGCTYVIGE
ncbi:uncharacterized protein J4E87_010741 [Alternaria ethzedia]|uniref:uncharacterized protein n=1 Tax=Alternaria metachromatica TaxID=283354 RepID=UPI0020C51A34|nr:uncharacterized protein J4E83_010751 [Alternaria metachromatica]XP_049206396.1 uncharacterized protein J4E79_010179 [Alternaria viburni]XP_049227945.1 uncharacterized protein J4E87_010741 [Alternaria ethzedia]XP_051303519.1 uncharacterized protein J4E86_004885 [Alternaria arbusti]XP_051322825.1 uncharacterized protein J4E85_008938 [Alternaria conjuncta]KAI4706692.1 hypothetical protein J4E89_008759 [Alternaria sp. Ai002NY15]KAI4605208.1 hypothetical protein J4E83_010751 [Alternaria metachr